MRCGLLIRTLRYGSWSSTDAKFDVPLKLSGYRISIRKWCIRNQCKGRYIAI